MRQISLNTERVAAMTDDDFDIWEMSDAELDREWQSLVNQYNEMITRMSPAEYFSYRRKRSLDLCLKIRQNMRDFPSITVFETGLRSTQKRLLMLRLERAGIKIGQA
jgi:hypothetical protein